MAQTSTAAVTRMGVASRREAATSGAAYRTVQLGTHSVPSESTLSKSTSFHSPEKRRKCCTLRSACTSPRSCSASTH